MKVVFKDSEVLICHEIKPQDSLHMVADDLYWIDVDEIEKIEDE